MPEGEGSPIAPGTPGINQELAGPAGQPEHEAGLTADQKLFHRYRGIAPQEQEGFRAALLDEEQLDHTRLESLFQPDYDNDKYHLAASLMQEWRFLTSNEERLGFLNALIGHL